MGLCQERKMKGEKTKDQIYWIVLYVQGKLMDKWKEKIVDEIFENRWKDRSVEDMLKEIEREFRKGKKIKEDIWKGLDSFGDVGKEMDGFQNVVKEKEMTKKEMPVVMATMPKKQMAKRGGKSGFWTRQRYSKKILRCFSERETLRKGCCYKTRVWTDFG